MNTTLTGKIVSTKMQKTVVVNVERKFRHHLYRKVIKTNKRIKAHCDLEGIQEGDMVSIIKVRPVSKQKHFAVVSKIDLHAQPVKEVVAKKTVKSESKEA